MPGPGMFLYWHYPIFLEIIFFSIPASTRVYTTYTTL
jgi:hypothetical protein